VSRYGNKHDAVEYAFPAIVCSSFALELFLKFFLMVDLIERGQTSQKVSFGHTIPDLWGKVTPAYKGLIAGMFQNTTGVPYTTSTELRLRLFEEALKFLGDQPFVRWRYAHELKEPQLMPHEAISSVVDAFGYAAEYVIHQMAPPTPVVPPEM